MIKLIVFDLDDTLYDADLYFEAAFKVISKFLTKKIHIKALQIEKKLWQIRRKKGSSYKKLFNDVLSEYKTYDEKLIRKLVELFHATPIKNLRPYDDVSEELNKLKKHYVLAILTHGNARKQNDKLKKLGIKKHFKFLISAKDKKISKENPKLFEELLKKGYKAEEIIYVGNNPLTDFKGPKKLGIITIRILRGEFAKVKVSKKEDADFHIKKFQQIKKIITKLSN